MAPIPSEVYISDGNGRGGFEWPYGMSGHVCATGHIKDPVSLVEKSRASSCPVGRFPLKPPLTHYLTIVFCLITACPVTLLVWVLCSLTNDCNTVAGFKSPSHANVTPLSPWQPPLTRFRRPSPVCQILQNIFDTFRWTSALIIQDDFGKGPIAVVQQD